MLLFFVSIFHAVIRFHKLKVNNLKIKAVGVTPALQRFHDWGKSCSGSQNTQVEKELSNLANAESSFLTILKDAHLASA